MQIIGVDLHTRQQTVAMLNVETGEMVEKTLQHEPLRPAVLNQTLARMVLRLNQRAQTTLSYQALQVDFGQGCVDPLRPPRLSGTDAILVTNCRQSFRCGRQRFLRRTSLISPNHKCETQLLHHGLLSLSTRRFYRVWRGFLLRRLDSRADFGTGQEEHHAPAPFFRKVVPIAFNA